MTTIGGNKLIPVVVFMLFNWLLQYTEASVPEKTHIQPYLNNQFGIRSQTWCISQDPLSFYLYFANSDGLIEFNGISWQRYPLPGNKTVRSVLAHTDGKIYTGSFEDFGFWQPDEEGKLIYTSLATGGVVEKNDEIWKIYAHGDSLYFQSFTTIYSLYNGAISTHKTHYTMLFLHQVWDRFIAQVIDNGLYWFKNGSFSHIDGSDMIASDKVHAIVPFKENQWLVCTDKAGLFIFDGAKFTFFNSEASDFLKSYSCNAALQLNDTLFAFGTISNGFIITDDHGNIQRSFNTINGLNDNTILSLFLDNDKGLWVGLDDGVNYLNLISPLTFYKTGGGTLGTIYAMLRQNNLLYIGTNHGLFKAEITGNGKIFNFGNPQFIPGSQGQVWTLEEIDGQIVFGHNDGTFLVGEKGLEKISPVTGGWAYTLRDNYMIGGTYTGLIVFEKSSTGKWKFRNRITDFREPIRFVETDYLGFIWASHHQKGLFKIELSDDLSSVIRVEQINLEGDEGLNINVFKINNRIVFATGKNIYTWDYVRNEIVNSEKLNEKLGEYTKSVQISHYQKNQYWFIMDDKMGLFEINLDFEVTRLLELQQNNINLPQKRIPVVTLNEHVVLRPNHQDFDAVDLEMAASEQPFSRLKIEQLYFYDKNGKGQWYKASPPEKIPSHISNLTVYFSDASGFSNYPRLFRFRIKELDQAWQSTYSNYFTYLDLKHGDYTIEVKNEGMPTTALSFSIAKPWYISATAFIIYILAIIALAWGIYSFLRHELRKQKELLALELRQGTLEKELDYKSSELLLTLRHLINKENILNDLQQQIEALKLESSKYPVKHIRNMERIISHGLGAHNAEWENAISNLKLSQQGFFKSLKMKYPQLTPNDLRMCSYLRMNFNSKEIAHLMNISTRGVDVSRSRLRKKLNLQHEDNLVEFLMKEDFDKRESHTMNS